MDLGKMDIGQFAYDIIINNLSDYIYDKAKYKILSWHQGRRMERRIEDAVADIVNPLLSFLSNEGVSREKQQRLIEICIEELSPITRDSEGLFRGSLNGDKIFSQLYPDGTLPQVISGDGLGDVYAMLFPRIASIICKVPEVIKDWEANAWAENYRRIDELSNQLQKLFQIIDGMASEPSNQYDRILSQCRRILAQSIRLQLDLSGFRSETPIIGLLDDYFIQPEIAVFRFISSCPVSNRKIEDVVSNESWTIERERLGEISNPKEFPSIMGYINNFMPSPSLSIVTGSAGSGKSTWVKWLQRELLSPHWEGICIRIELRRYNSEPLPSIYDLVRGEAPIHLRENLSTNCINDWIDGGKILFLLDGLDEISSNRKAEVFQWLIDLMSILKSCSIIVTTRRSSSDQLRSCLLNEPSENIDHRIRYFEIMPFKEEQIIEYISRWYKHAPLLKEGQRVIDAQKLTSLWKSDPIIEPLTSNPLLLSTLLLVNHLDGNLPSGRSQLYERYVNGMLDIWDSRRGILSNDRNITKDQKRTILASISYRMFLQENTQLTDNELQEWLPNIIAHMELSLSVIEILDLLQERTGLLMGPGVYSFTHKTISEFLLADAIYREDPIVFTDDIPSEEELLEYSKLEKWNTIIFWWAGLLPHSRINKCIDECLAMELLPLAFGLIYDQYERITIDLRRRWLFHLFRAQIYYKIGNEFYLGVNGRTWVDHRCSVQLATCAIGLANITNIHVGVLELLWKAIRDGTITWKEDNELFYTWRDIMWLLFATQIRTLEDWIACIETDCPKRGVTAISEKLDERVIIQWVLERLIIQTIDHQEDSIGLYINIFLQKKPIAKAMLPLVILWILLKYICMGSQWDRFHLDIVWDSNPMNEIEDINWKWVNKLLELLKEVEISDVDPETLVDSKRWEGDENRTIYPFEKLDDGLRVIQIILGDLSETTNYIRSDIYESTKAYIWKLIEARKYWEDRITNRYFSKP